MKNELLLSSPYFVRADWRVALKLVAQILEVVRADAQLQHFLDHRKEVSEGTNRTQRRPSAGRIRRRAAARTNAFSMTVKEMPCS